MRLLQREDGKTVMQNHRKLAMMENGKTDESGIRKCSKIWN